MDPSQARLLKSMGTKIVGAIIRHVKEQKYKKQISDSIYGFFDNYPLVLRLFSSSEVNNILSNIARGEIQNIHQLIKAATEYSKKEHLPTNDEEIISVLLDFAYSINNAFTKAHIKLGDHPVALKQFLEDMQHEKTRFEERKQRSAKRDQQIEKILQKLRERVLKTFSSRKSYDIRLSFVDSINEIPLHWNLKRDYEMEALKSQDLLSDSYENNQILIQAPGGFGKTSFLIDLLEQAKNSNYFPFYLDLSRSIDVSNTDINGSVPHWEKKLFSAFSLAGIFEDIKELANEYKILIIADGLNECKLDYNETLTFLNQIELNLGKGLLVVSDRMLEKQNLYDYKMATILPLSRTVISTNMKTDIKDDTFLRLLSMPFFLDLYNSYENKSHCAEAIPKNRIQMIEDYFKEIGKINNTEFELLGKCALTAYEKSESTEFDNQDWETCLGKEGNDIADRLQQAGITYTIERDDGTKCMFRHQILHDFLVGRYLYAMGHSFWRPEIFESATFGKSFEVLEFTAEYLPENDADTFLIEVYDWSWIAVINIINRLQSIIPSEKISFSPLLAEAFCATLAEKQFDHFEHSSERIKNRLASFKSTFDIDYLNYRDITSLLKEIYSKLSPQLSEDDSIINLWINVFCCQSLGTVESNKFFSFLWGDPLLAWTTANVFKRQFLNNDIYQKLVEFYDALYSVCNRCPKTISTRWRIVHILGKFPDKKNIDFLTTVVFNESEHKDIRYGAVRSLVEALSFIDDPDYRNQVLKLLSKRLIEIDKHRIVRELRRTALHRIPEAMPENWVNDYMPILISGKNYFYQKKDITEVMKWEAQTEKLSER